MPCRFLRAIPICILFLLPAPLALAVCVADVGITADLLPAPDEGMWRYTMTIAWSYRDHTTSTWQLYAVVPGTDCDCTELAGQYRFPDDAGAAIGAGGGCEVPYAGALECGPDSPSPDYPYLTFVAGDGTSCTMPDGGVTTLVFDSVLPPVATDGEFLLVVDRTCAIAVHGVRPAYSCGAVRVDGLGWGSLKATYR
ncbi:hypothetical protein KDM41_03910 [bacterium]|nr:hypothetical protein [bacterium]